MTGVFWYGWDAGIEVYSSLLFSFVYIGGWID